MAQLLAYPPLPTAQVIELLRQLRTSQVAIMGQLKDPKRPRREGILFTAEQQMLRTMQTHIDALGNAIEQLTRMKNLELPIEKLRGKCNAEINRINSEGADATPGFNRINELLKSCDLVFNEVR